MPAGEETRLLIVTGAAVADSEELPPLVQSLIEAASKILVVTPVLPAPGQPPDTWFATVVNGSASALTLTVDAICALNPASLSGPGAKATSPLGALPK
jgi:hypothetical protein